MARSTKREASASDHHRHCIAARTTSAPNIDAAMYRAELPVAYRFLRPISAAFRSTRKNRGNRRVVTGENVANSPKLMKQNSFQAINFLISQRPKRMPLLRRTHSPG
jgi:hypothetical protein